MVSIVPRATSVEAIPTEVSTKLSQRLASVDTLRGAVMVLMLLDHTRDFFGDLRVNPVNLTQTTVALFFTRWVTHFCAPTFVFLAGMGAYLAGAQGKSRRELADFLFTRGLWLVFLELTVVRFGLTFDPTFSFIPLTVIWVIGLAMVVLSGLVFLPTPLIAVFGIVLIAGHNALDGPHPEWPAAAQTVWRFLHERALLGVFWGRTVFSLYPLIPWIGVLAAGYAFGSVFRLEPLRRRFVLLSLGFALTLAFAGLRATNLYGDPRLWVSQATPAFTVLSFLNCEKYPPSLLFLLMTLGPAIVALAFFERADWRVLRPLATLGRVPLFYYLLQWYLIHSLAVIVAWVCGQPTAWLIGQGPFEPPPAYGHGLPFVYAMWLVCLTLLYPLCAWFAALKRRRRDPWLSYI